MAEIKMERVKFLPLVVVCSIFVACTVPYIGAVISEKVHWFLPFISHAAAFPPYSAILSIFMAIGAFFGVPSFFLRYAAIDQRISHLDPKKIKTLNKTAVVIGLIALISMLFASHYPIGYVTHEKSDWVYAVLVPHCLSTGLLMISFTVYVLIQAYLTYALRKRSTKNVFIHATLAMCVVVTTWTAGLPLTTAVKDMIPSVINEKTGEISLETKEYNFFYIISSMSEWAFLFFSMLFIATFYRDLKNMKLRVKFSEKPITSITLDSVQPAVHATFNGHDEITKM